MDNFLRQTAAGRPAGSAHSRDWQPPPNLTGFHTGRLLGIGGSARVWLVQDQGTGAERALKVLPGAATHSGPGGGSGNEQLTQLYRETAVLGSLNHPHLLRFHGVVSTDQGPGLLTDYAGGGSLLNLVTARGRLSVGECITVLAPVAQALAYLHEASVQHGDVSPGNVLFTAEGKPLLADLGVGRLLGEDAAGGAGTTGFADPVLATELGSGYLSDVYSLAAIGWYSLTGSAPGCARERVPLTLLVPEVPQELLHVLEAGLREDPQGRPSAAEIGEAVLRSAEPQPLDLVAAVHPSVLPELLTRRRAAGDQVQKRRRRFAVLFERWRIPRPTPLRVLPEPASRGSGRRSARVSGRTRIRSRLVPLAAAALLVVCGALLAAPYFVGATGERGNTEAPAQHRAVADTEERGSRPATGVQLSPAITKRLADADPVKALSALVGIRAVVLATGDAGLLSNVNVEDSEAMNADRDLVARLQERGHVFNGLSIRLQEAAPAESIAVPEGAVAVGATAVMSGYTETDREGEAVRQVAESTPQDLVFVLMKEKGTWKIASVHTKDTF